MSPRLKCCCAYYITQLWLHQCVPWLNALFLTTIGSVVHDAIWNKIHTSDDIWPYMYVTGCGKMCKYIFAFLTLTTQFVNATTTDTISRVWHQAMQCIVSCWLYGTFRVADVQWVGCLKCCVKSWSQFACHRCALFVVGSSQPTSPEPAWPGLALAI